ncbi:hypothetical protein LGM75_11425 [Burkholderia multivorans]|uniref:hypothetical protein n=1 Tax=Burkholderia multivorans TaxID=87883 RepID=UPI001E490EC9|nr:hypothetical protein [Burkholderia multivorans]MCA8126964.1 hypothetical protein [Burkholderia multivorans]
MPFLAPQVRHRRLARNAGRASTKTIGALNDAAHFVSHLISFHVWEFEDRLAAFVRRRRWIASASQAGADRAFRSTGESAGGCRDVLVEGAPARRPIAASVFHELRIDERAALSDRATRRSRRSRRSMRCRHAASRAGSLIVVIELRGWNGWEDC